jgi:hypothetical protein
MGYSAEDAIKEGSKLSNAASIKICEIFMVGSRSFNCKTLLFEKYSRGEV